MFVCEVGGGGGGVGGSANRLSLEWLLSENYLY